MNGTKLMGLLALGIYNKEPKLDITVTPMSI